MAYQYNPNHTIHVEIKLFATLSKYTPPNSNRFELPAGTTADNLTLQLNLPKEQIKLIFINGRKYPAATVLKDGDRIGIFPPVGGG